MRRFGVMIVGLVMACGGGGAKAKEPEAGKAKELGAMCDRYYARERVCVDEYLAALLEVRVEYDMPAGIKAEVERDGRDAVLARMRPEWERDTTIENTDRMCRDMEAQVPAERIDELLAAGERCYAEADCEGFVACTVEDQRSYIQSGAPPH